jgi:hypothetical protein
MDGRKEGAPSSILISVVAASLFLSVCSGLQFDISALQKKCFTEELNVKGLVLANYRLISDNTTKISSKVNTLYVPFRLLVPLFFPSFDFPYSELFYESYRCRR